MRELIIYLYKYIMLELFTTQKNKKEIYGLIWNIGMDDDLHWELGEGNMVLACFFNDLSLNEPRRI